MLLLNVQSLGRREELINIPSRQVCRGDKAAAGSRAPGCSGWSARKFHRRRRCRANATCPYRSSCIYDSKDPQLRLQEARQFYCKPFFDWLKCKANNVIED